MTKKSNEQVFPMQGNENFYPTKGFTKREFYAIHMISGLVTGYKGDMSPKEMIELAIGYADALIEELEKEK